MSKAKSVIQSKSIFQMFLIKFAQIIIHRVYQVSE